MELGSCSVCSASDKLLPLAKPTPTNHPKQDPVVQQSLRNRLASGSISIFTAVGISDPLIENFLLEATGKLPTALFWGCTPPLMAAHRVDGYAPETAGPIAAFAARAVSWSKEARASRVLSTLSELWGRYTSDDLLFTWLVVINEYFTVRCGCLGVGVGGGSM